MTEEQSVTFGRYEETPPERMSVEMRDAYDFTKKLRGMIPDRTGFGWRIRDLRKPSCQRALITRTNRH